MTNQTISNNIDEKSIQFVLDISTVMGYRVVPAISGAGVITNIISLFVLFNLKSKENFKYIIVKTFLYIIGSLFGIGFQNNMQCEIDEYILKIPCIVTASYPLIFLKAYIFKYIITLCFFWDGTNEILLTLDRYLILKNRKNWFNKSSTFKYILIVNGLLAVILYLPYTFMINVEIVPNKTDTYFLKSSKFSTSTLGFVYILLSRVGIFILLILVLIVSSIMVVFQLRKYVRTHAQLANNVSSELENKLKRSETNMIKITMILSIILIIVRVFDLLATLLPKKSIIDANNGIRIPTFYKLFLVVLGYVSYIMVYTQCNANLFILFAFNKKFRKSFKNVYLEDRFNSIVRRLVTATHNE